MGLYFLIEEGGIPLILREKKRYLRLLHLFASFLERSDYTEQFSIF